jgi:hypothetical protein
MADVHKPETYPGMNEWMSWIKAALTACGLKADFSITSDIAMCLRFKVLSPLLITTGSNDDVSQWTFTNGPEGLLVGDQTVGQVLLLPKPVTQMPAVTGTVFADIGLWGIGSRRYGQPVEAQILPLTPLSSTHSTK